MSSSAYLDVHDVFISHGIPTVTYVKRDNGKYERKIADLVKKGHIVFIHGPSKCGKSVLSNNYAEKEKNILHQMNCSDFRSSSEFFWRLATQLGIPIEHGEEDKKGTSRGTNLIGQIKTALGIVDLDLQVGINASTTTEHITKNVMSTNIPKQVVKSKRLLIFDNFHYINNIDVQREILRELRDMVEKERIGIIIIAITSDPNYLGGICGELTGRYSPVTIKRWTEDELQQIPNLGFKVLNIGINNWLNQELTNNCFQSPAIMQELCLQISLYFRINNANQGFRNIDAASAKSDFPKIFKSAAEESLNMFTPYQKLIQMGKRIYNGSTWTLRENSQRNINEDKQVTLSEALIQLLACGNGKARNWEEIKLLSKQYIIESMDLIDNCEGTKLLEDLYIVSVLLLEEQHDVRTMLETSIFQKPSNGALSLVHPYFSFYVKWSGHIEGVD